MSSKPIGFSLAAHVQAELKVKGSKFIAHAAPVDSREAAETYVGGVADRFADATHNCFAYKIGVGDRAEIRFSDAGEPSGTAGRPILQAIESRRLVNVAVVVTRYFGGTKLGTGGLIRAYAGAALAALERGELVPYVPKCTLRLQFNYQLANAVHGLLHRFGAAHVESRFDDLTEYVVTIGAGDEAAFVRALQDQCRGRIQVHKIA